MERKFEVNSGEGRTKGEGNSDVEDVVALGVAAEVLAGLGAFLPLERAMVHSAVWMQVIVHLEPGIRSSTASTVSRRVRSQPELLCKCFLPVLRENFRKGRSAEESRAPLFQSLASRGP